MNDTYLVQLSGTPIEKANQRLALLSFANLPVDDKNRICEIITNKKALAKLKSNWTMLKMMFR